MDGNPGNFCLESWTLESEIQLLNYGILESRPFEIWNTLSWNPESSIWNAGCGVWNLGSKMVS